jgi:hypothetical protein
VMDAPCKMICYRLRRGRAAFNEAQIVGKVPSEAVV